MRLQGRPTMRIAAKATAHRCRLLRVLLMCRWDAERQASNTHCVLLPLHSARASVLATDFLCCFRRFAGRRWRLPCRRKGSTAGATASTEK